MDIYLAASRLGIYPPLFTSTSVNIEKKLESCIKDTTDFINFMENTQIPDNLILATLDVSSLHTNIPQEEGIDIVCRYYDHYEQKLTIPTHDLRELMRPILEESSFTVLFNNMRTLKFKSQPTNAFFATVNQNVRRFLPASDYCRARDNQIKSLSTVQTT